MNRKRNIQLDFIRVISMLFVIGIHTNRKPFSDNLFLSEVLMTVLYTCNSNFYMLSGELNLQKKFEKIEDYKIYYLNKLCSIMVPYIVVTFILSLIEIFERQEVTICSYLEYTYRAFMSGNASNHMWFMYPLLGMIISAPFLAKMLNAMKKEEIDILLLISVVWGVISIFLTENIGVSFSYSGWFLSSWAVYFFAGYYQKNNVSELNMNKFFVWGGACFIITVLCKCLIADNFKFSTDLAPTYLFFVIAEYTLLKEKVLINNTVLKEIIYFLARYSFIIYLIHYEVLISIRGYLMFIQNDIIYFLFCIVVTLAISLLLAIVLDFLILKPVQKVIRKLCL